MTDISKIRGEHISELAGAYLHAAFVFGIDPMEASDAKQRRIRKWIGKQYTQLVHELTEEANVFSTENSDRDVLLLLKECVALVESAEREKELLPLVEEIAALEWWMELPEQELFSFNELKKSAHQYGYNKTEIIFGKLETIKPGDNAFYKTVKN